MQFVHFYYLDLHFLQFPISLLVLACCLIPAVPNHPPSPHPTLKPPLDLVFIVSFFTLISMLTPLSAPVHSAPVHSATFLCYGQPSTPQTPPSQLTPFLFMHTLLHLHPSALVHIPNPTPKPHLDLIFIVLFLSVFSILTPSVPPMCPYVPLCAPTYPYLPLHAPRSHTSPYFPLCAPTCPYVPLHAPMSYYMPLCTPTSHYVPLHVPMSHYVPLHSTTCPYVPLRTPMCHYLPIHASYVPLHAPTCHYVPLHTPMYPYVPLCAPTCPYMPLRAPQKILV